MPVWLRVGGCNCYLGNAQIEVAPTWKGLPLSSPSGGGEAEMRSHLLILYENQLQYTQYFWVASAVWKGSFLRRQIMVLGLFWTNIHLLPHSPFPYLKIPHFSTCLDLPCRISPFPQIPQDFPRTVQPPPDCVRKLSCSFAVPLLAGKCCSESTTRHRFDWTDHSSICSPSFGHKNEFCQKVPKFIWHWVSDPKIQNSISTSAEKSSLTST